MRACIIDFGGSWDSYLSLVEFYYNNNFHYSMDLPLFQLLYGRKYRTQSVGVRLVRDLWGDEGCAQDY